MAVVERCAYALGVCVDEVLSRNRKQQVAMARHYVCWVLNKMFLWPKSHIGKMLDRDHTSVINSIEVVDNLAMSEPFSDGILTGIIRDVERYRDRWTY